MRNKSYGTIRLGRTRVDASLADIPHGSTLNHVPDGEPLDSLVLGHAARAVRAADKVDMATSLLVATAGPSFLSLPREQVDQQKVIRDDSNASDSNSAQNRIDSIPGDWIGVQKAIYGHSPF